MTPYYISIVKGGGVFVFLKFFIWHKNKGVFFFVWSFLYDIKTSPYEREKILTDLGVVFFLTFRHVFWTWAAYLSGNVLRTYILLFFLTNLVIFPIPLALLLPSMLKNFSVVENWKSLGYIYCDCNVIKVTQDHWSKTKEGLNVYHSINVSDQNLWYFLKMLKWQSLIVKPYSSLRPRKSQK